jgi:S-adenosyl methyltransferase
MRRIDTLAAFPALGVAMRENRSALCRVTAFLAGEMGVRQFLDIGTGIPTRPSVHGLAQAIDPTARIVYTDNDPIVLVHARALLTGTPEGRTAYLHADLRDPDRIIDHARQVLDFSEPVAVLVFGILMFIPNAADPFDLLRRLVAPLAKGSYLALTHPSHERHTPEEAANLAASYERSGIPFQFRSEAEIARFFDGLTLLEPGLVLTSSWRPEGEPSPVGPYMAVGRKP